MGSSVRWGFILFNVISRQHRSENMNTREAWLYSCHRYRRNEVTKCISTTTGVETGEPQFSASPQGGGLWRQRSSTRFRPIVRPLTCGNVCNSLLDPSEEGGSQKSKMEKTKQ